ncbi:MAG: hypothetical protein NXI13_16325 [Proteobacteria bacterium]|nr:hypothetical protein [Pseudomonadota bacterium]
MTPEIEYACKLYEIEGLPLREIGKKIRRNDGTVARWRDKYGWKRTAFQKTQIAELKRRYETTDEALHKIARSLRISTHVATRARSQGDWERPEGYEDRLSERRALAAENKPPLWPKVTATWPEWARFDGMEIGLPELQQEDNDARQAFARFQQNVRCVG